MELNDKIEELKELIERPRELQVAVYGKYNHGKSSLLNALVKKEVFKTADIRETITIKSHTKDNITWVDTPGLDADVKEKDDNKAKEILSKSDLLLFVHSANEGELDKKELTFLEERYKENNNILFILTQIDKLSEVKAVQDEIENQLKKSMLNSIDIIAVSSKRANHENEKIRQMSNIENIKKTIMQEKEKILQNRSIQKETLKEEIKELINLKLRNLKQELEDIMNEKMILNISYTKELRNIMNRKMELL